MNYTRDTQPSFASMRRKQKNLLRTRYMTDLMSRWKLGASLSELEDKLAEYKKVGELNEEEERAFRTSFKDQMYATLVAEYQDYIRFRRAKLVDLRHYVKQDAPYPSVQKRLIQQINEWRRLEEDTLYTTILEQYQILLTNGATLDELHDRVEDDTLLPRVRDRLWDRIEEWERDRAMLRPANELARMAKDAQNIHTLAVSRQTNTMMDHLAPVVVPAAQKTMKEILTAWETYSVDTHVVEQDMRVWASKSYVVEKDDFLYRKTLRSVWAKIQTYPASSREELIRRLWEECSEAVGMCAQGHIGRLLNVFVGFDDTIRDDECFQDKMASIARMNIDSTKKIEEAIRIMDSIQMDVRDRQPWLDAF